jgi:hypothetical protein
MLTPAAPPGAIDAHDSITAVLQYLIFEHAQGRPVDMGILLTAVAAINELAAPAMPSSDIRAVLARLGLNP